MRAFNLTAPTLDASYANAIQAGSLSHTGNSFRPIGAPVKWVENVHQLLPPTSTGFRPRANPVRVTQGLNGSTISTITTTPGQIVSRPIAHPIAPIRGILGQ